MAMIRRDNPCHYCTERATYCRLKCSKWMRYVERRNAEYENPHRKAESDFIGETVDRIERCRKRINKKNRRYNGV